VTAALRLFVAVEPPEQVRGELANWARRALGRGSGARRLAPESLHLTMCFLGEQPPAVVEEIAAVLAGQIKAFAAVEELAVGAPAWLPPRRPRVLAVEVGDPEGTLRDLHGALSRELAACLAWQPPHERFRPHITLARMRPGSERARELEPTPPLIFAPTALTLFRSSLDPGGAIYAPLASVPPP
jgi:2'-5' RNA ligase